MNFSQWKYFSRSEYTDSIKPDFEVSDGILKVRTAGEKYSSAQFDSVSKDIKSGFNYRIFYELKTENPLARVLFGWYKGDEALVKGYLNKSGEEILCPDGADSLRITLRFNSYDAYEGEISPVTGECTGEHKPRKVKLASVAIPNIFYPASQPQEYNLEETVKQIDRLCKKYKPDIIALTETFYTRKTLEEPHLIALPADSRPIKVICEKAKEYNTYIALSFLENEDGYIYNSGFLIDRNGKLAGKCHKCHLTMGEYECGYAPGKEIKVFDTDFGKVGIAICWDIFFPEHIRAMQKQGVEVIINSTAGYSETRIAERCREAGAFIVTATSAGYQMSGIFNPYGEKIADASAEFGIVCKEVDLNEKYYWEWMSYPSLGRANDIYLNELRTDII